MSPEALVVVFVCQHGNGKSLIASQLFDRLAAERGLSVRAVARGVAPETPVPAPIVERLARDGFDVTSFEPREFSPADLAGSARAVLVGVDAPAWIERGDPKVETWNGIPPASADYEASRDAMRDRIVALLDAIAGREP